MNCYLDPALPAFLKGDSVRLRQILVNLLGNAIKFTEHGEVTLKCELLHTNSDTVEWLFSISDTGIGIPAGKLDIIFESFTQSDASTIRKFGGTGLGLTIAKQLVELMDGRIWVESKVGQGSTFHFTVKLGVQTEPKKPVRIYPEDLQGLKTLVVDDNATNRLILKNILQRWGALVTEAKDAEQGLLELQRAHATSNPYALMLLDCRMPGMDGFQMAEQINNNPAITGLPIMMLTSDDRSGHAERAVDLGISVYMVKPVKRFELLKTISAVLGETRFPAEEFQAAPESPVPENLSPSRILLAEDYRHNRLIVQQYLKNMPIQVDVAENGAIAVEKFKAAEYDLVLMDMQMPVMDGYTATRRIRAAEAARAEEQKSRRAERRVEDEQEENVKKSQIKNLKSKIPIIALTAYALKEDIRKSLDAGCNNHLSKPIKKTALLEMIARYAGNVGQERVAENQGLSKDLISPEPDHLDTVHDPDNRSIVYVNQDFAEFIPEFLEDIRHDAQVMAEALTNGDWETIRELSHGIKGAGGGYGLGVFSDIAQSLEEAARQKNLKEAQQWLGILSNYLERIQVVCRTSSGSISIVY